MSEPATLKCACSHCGGRLEFPVAALNTRFDCPHCGRETKLTAPGSAPRRSSPPAEGQGNKCACQHCGGRIAFPPEAVNTTIPCPHCGKDTKLGAPSDGAVTSGANHPEPMSIPLPLRQESGPYAGFWIRALAKLLDALILLPVIAVIVFAFAELMPRILPLVADWPVIPKTKTPLLVLASALAALPVLFVYHTGFLARWGATPGKILCRLRVVDSEGARLSVYHAAHRFFMELLLGVTVNLLFFQVNYLIAAFDDQKRTLHDRLSKTRVVRWRPPARAA